MNEFRGIESGRPRRDTITYVGPVQQPAETALDDLASYYALGGSCPSCEREGWIDRHAIRRKWGNAYLSSLSGRLRCLGCDNRTGNKWILGQLPR